ncbi:hypothetical protein AALO_G00068070 [Alosa alosa]|uniref:ILEI/PANDER domain-containing protein n=2 Tax=Alosa alosa TaxID=278164 RepID=A0AAV6H204_9TELE|nr:hypothetical protein AALO_G00068070 [Alosa alosa]
MMAKSYTFHWDGVAPKEIVLSLINFDKDDWALVGLCYPTGTTFQVRSDINDRQSNTFTETEDYGPVSSLAELQKRTQERKYFFDRSVGLLWLDLRARHGREGHSYCSALGCERVIITAYTASKQTCDCTAKAYPTYRQTPTAVVPMPAPNAKPCEQCGASKLIFSSDPWNSYLQTEIKSLSSKEEQSGDLQSYITVNGKRFPLAQSGFLLVTVDACSGQVTKSPLFPNLDSKMEQYLKTGIPARSIVLIGTRGSPSGIASIAQYLVPLGAAKVADLQKKVSLAFFGLRSGSSYPPWITLLSAQGEEGLGVQERYLPLALEEYGCPQAGPPKRKDLDLLRKALNQK